MDITKHRKLVVGGAAAAFVLGAGAIAGAAVGAGPFESGDDDPVLDTGGTSLPAGAVDLPVGGSATYAAGDAGFVTIARETDDALRVVGVSPAPGWQFAIESDDDPGEVEVDFTDGARRVRFDAEVEDAAVRIRVRDEATDDGPSVTLPSGSLPDDDGPSATLPDGTVPDTLPSGTLPDDDLDDDSANRGPGSDDSGHDADDDHGNDDDDDVDDDHGGSSGHGGGDD